MSKVLSGELSCTRTGLVTTEMTFKTFHLPSVRRNPFKIGLFLKKIICSLTNRKGKMLELLLTKLYQCFCACHCPQILLLSERVYLLSINLRSLKVIRQTALYFHRQGKIDCKKYSILRGFSTDNWPNLSLVLLFLYCLILTCSEAHLPFNA